MQTTLIQNGRVLTMGPKGTLESGAVLVKNGKIAAVGERLDVPDGAEVIDARGALVMPGLIDSHCHIGVLNSGTGFEGEDGNEFSSPVTPELRAVDGINPQDPEFALAVQSGITLVATGPGSANPIAGQFAALKTWGNTVEAMLVKAPLAMKVAFGENPKRAYGAKDRQPVTRMATAALLREWLNRALEYIRKQAAAEEDPGKAPAYDAKLEALAPVVRGEMPLKAHAHRADDVMTALRIAEEFDLDITLDHCTEGHLIAGELAKAGKPVILGPVGVFPQKFEMGRQRLETAAILHGAGVKIALCTDLPATHLWFLPLAAGLCVAAGLPMQEGLKSITVNAAGALGLQGRVGTLETGKDADIAVFTQNPLESLSARCVLTLIDGAVRHDTLRV